MMLIIAMEYNITQQNNIHPNANSTGCDGVEQLSPSMF